MQESKLVRIKYADFQFELLPEILILLKGNAWLIFKTIISKITQILKMNYD